MEEREFLTKDSSRKRLCLQPLQVLPIWEKEAFVCVAGSDLAGTRIDIVLAISNGIFVMPFNHIWTFSTPSTNSISVARPRV